MPKVLLIEDDPTLVQLLTEQLRQQSCTVESAGSGRAGLALAYRWQPDLILLDLILPDIDGTVVLDELFLADSPSHPQVPVVVVSSSRDPADMVTCLDLGALDFISKPCNLDVLAAKVRRALAFRYAQQVLARTNQHLSQLAAVDALTQLYNRRRLFELAVRELARCRRYERDLGVVMMDVDNFKQFNDTFGHAAGDRVLQQMAKILRQYTRDTDIVGRIGGEEFAICCPETGLEGVIQLAERIRCALQSSALELEGRQLTVTASFGVSTLCDLDKSFEGLLQRADRMLYRAKSSGRNQVLSA